MINSMDYVCVASRKQTRGSGLDVGQKALVIGMKDLPEKRSDPYLLRRYALIIKVDDDGTHHMPNIESGDEDNGERTFLVDPRSLEKLDEDTVKALAEGFKQNG